MAKYLIILKTHVQDNDQDLMLSVPDAIQDRFRGTALHIDRITVEREDD